MPTPTDPPASRLNPTWAQNLCALGPRPIVMTGALRLWLTGHFSSPDTIEDKTAPVADMVWTSDPATTRLVVESVTSWQPSLTEKRPAIILKRNAWRRVRLGIGDRMMGQHAMDGQAAFANLWVGSHTLFCLAGKGPEAEKLGAEVYRELNQFSQTVRSLLALHRVALAEFGEQAILNTEARQNYVVPIVLGYVFEEAYAVTRETAVLRSVDLALMEP